jgi:hypothetical protein
MIALLAWAPSVVPQLIPRQFYLEDYAARDGRYHAGASLSRHELGAESAVYDLAGAERIPLWYTGSILGPYSRGRASEQTHAVSAAYPGRWLRASLTLGVAGKMLYNNISENTSNRGGPPGKYGHCYSRDRMSHNRHVRLRYMGAVNLQAPVGDYSLTLSAAGGLVQHWGFSYSSLHENTRGIVHSIREYEPRDLSAGWSAGALVSGDFEVGQGLFHTVVGVRHSRTNEHMPLRAELPLIPDDAVPLCVVGSRGATRSTWLWAGWRTARRYDALEERLLCRGELLTGFTIAEGLVRIGKIEHDSLEVRYYPHSSGDSLGLWRRSGRTPRRDSYTTVAPELYITRHVSFSAPMGIWALARGESRDSYRRLGGSLAGAIHVRVPLGKRGLLAVVSARSGDLEIETEPGLETSPLDLFRPVYYRAYRARLEIKLMEPL